jgi:Co/Zn/Cd efflux system component
MADHCCAAEKTFDGTSRAFRRALWIVIALNAAMFVVEMAAGYAARSTALNADALDFLGDTLTYAISLAVIGLSLRTRALAALGKGLSLAVMSTFVLGLTFYRVAVLGAPNETIMAGIAALALAANMASVAILLRFREGDANVRSVWLCSRNDAIGNLFVMLAALGVWRTGTGWPDLAVAFGMAVLFLSSSIQIVRQANGELAQAPAPV